LAWDANTESNLAGYRVYRADHQGTYSSQPLNGSTLVTSTSWTDSTVETNRSYYYVVRAVSIEAGESDNSNEIVVTVNAAGTTGSDLVAHNALFSVTPPVALTQSGRVYAETQGPVNTAVTINNPNTATVILDFYVTDTNGTELYSNRTSIPVDGQISALLSEVPFAPPPGISLSSARTFTAVTSGPVTMTAVRGFTNERSEFLMTPLAVAQLSSGAGSSIMLPYDVSGDVWEAEVQLVNPSNSVLSGVMALVSAADPSNSISNLPYQIAPRAATSLRVPLTGSQTHSGWFRITPFNGTPTPAGFLILSLHVNGITVSETGISSVSF
jgi:hypothetical protein